MQIKCLHVSGYLRAKLLRSREGGVSVSVLNCAYTRSFSCCMVQYYNVSILTGSYSGNVIEMPICIYEL